MKKQVVNVVSSDDVFVLNSQPLEISFTDYNRNDEHITITLSRGKERLVEKHALICNEGVGEINDLVYDVLRRCKKFNAQIDVDIGRHDTLVFDLMIEPDPEFVATVLSKEEKKDCKFRFLLPLFDDLLDRDLLFANNKDSVYRGSGVFDRFGFQPTHLAHKTKDFLGRKLDEENVLSRKLRDAKKAFEQKQLEKLLKERLGRPN